MSYIKKENELKKKALIISIKEGSAASVSSGMGDSFITLFALAIKSSATQIGLIGSFPGLLSPIAQFFGSRLMEKQSRQKIVVRNVLLQATTWVPIAIIAILFYFQLAQRQLPWLLIIIYSLLAIFGGLSGPAWFSWMGDIVPENERGRYFGKRNRICLTVSVVSIILAAFLLDRSTTLGLVMIGFAVLFFFAFLGRFISYSYFKKQYEPKLKLNKKYYFSFWAFLKKYTNFTKFTIFTAVFNFAICICSIFFAVYMKEYLGFSYVMVMTVNLSMSIFILLFNPLAGKFSDKYGNLKLLYIGSFLLAAYPIGWIFIKSPIMLIFIPQLIGGIANAAYGMANTNFIYDTVTPQRRGLCLSYMSILSGVGIFLGSMLGGFLIDNLPYTFVPSIILVFIISIVGRFLVPLIMLPKIKERRKFEPISLSTYFWNPSNMMGRINRLFIQTSYSKRKIEQKIN